MLDFIQMLPECIVYVLLIATSYSLALVTAITCCFLYAHMYECNVPNAAVVTSPGHKGIGRLLVIVMEGVGLTASDANGNLHYFAPLTHSLII